MSIINEGNPANPERISMTKQPPPPTSTRERILAHLREHRTTTVVALSRAWGLTRADLRYHLTGLVEEGLVELVPRDPGQPVGRGRPIQVYRLAVETAPGNLLGLCHAALELLLNSLPEAEKEARLRQLAEMLAGGALPTAHGIQRYNQAAAFLNARNYRARWEASPTGPRFLLRGCPNAALLPSHPELCRMDRHLLEHLTGLPLQQTARMDVQTGKPPACVFIPAQETGKA